jgi:sugar lactone lactonase YvrE
LEAVESDASKALQFNVPASARGLTLQLGPTGTVKGLVKIPGATDLKDVVVTLPGTPYRATTNERGEYTLANVPAGDGYSLTATKDGIGTANMASLSVQPNKTISVSDVLLGSEAPLLTGLAPSMGGRGTLVTLTGANLPEAGLIVDFGTSVLADVTRLSATQLRVKVPEGNVGEDVRVRAGTIVSNTLKFKLLTSLTINPGPTTLTVGASQAFTASAVDAAGMAIATPTVRWEVSGGSGLAVDADTGLVSASQVGSANLVARSGDLTSPPVSLTAAAGGGVGGNTGARTFTVSTVAGGGDADIVNGALGTARFMAPTGVALVPDANPPVLYVVDSGANQLRRITPAAVESVAGAATSGTDDGVGAVARFDAPVRIKFDRYFAGGESYLVADRQNHRIRRYTVADNRVETIAGGGAGGPLGGGYALGVGTDARFNAPAAAVAGPGGAVFVADTLNHCIRRIDPVTRDVTVIAGAPGQAGSLDGATVNARFAAPTDLAVADDGTLYVADAGNKSVREITPGGVVSTIAGRDVDRQDVNVDATYESPVGLALAGRRLYVADSLAHRIRVIDLDATPRSVSTVCGATAGFQDGASPLFNQPQSLAFDAAGDLYVADTANRRVRKIDFSN